MDFSYIGWVFSRTKVATLAYYIASFVVWVLTGAEGGLGTLVSVVGLWALLFWIHTKGNRPAKSPTELQH